MDNVGVKKSGHAKRERLGSATAKGQTVSTAKIKAPSGSLIPVFDIRRAADLGKGYILVQLKERGPGGGDYVATGKGPAARLVENYPEIPERDIKALLKELAERSSGSVTPLRPAPETRAQTRSKLENIPDDNLAFLDKLSRQSLANRARQLEDGLLLTSADVCSRRQITRQALSRAVKNGNVFWLDGPSGMQLYPHFFAKQKPERLAFEKVARALGDIPGASKWQFFTTPKRSLGGISPAEALDKGVVDPVIAAACAFGER